MVFLKEGITTKLLSIEQELVEEIFIDLNFLKKKSIIFGGYNPNRKNIAISGDVKTNLDLYCTDYESLIVTEDFNKESNQSDMKDFCGFYKLNNLIKEPTCYKHLENSSCINLTLGEKCPNTEFFLVLIFPHAD